VYSYSVPIGIDISTDTTGFLNVYYFSVPFLVLKCMYTEVYTEVIIEM